MRILNYRFLYIVVFLLITIYNISSAQQSVGKIECICIDAGHGGSDPGAVNGKVEEKNITLAVALKLGVLIKKKYPNMKIIYTRDSDKSVDLKERGRIANRAKAQLFISIHVNSFKKNRAVQGIETYVLGLHKSEASLQVAMKENKAIHYEEDYSVKYDGFDPSKTESYIMFNFMKNSFLVNSMAFASFVQKNLVTDLKAYDREVRQAGFIVLMNVGMPSVLVEVGFITNSLDLRILTSESGQNRIAQSIFKAFVNYKSEMDRNSVILNQEKVKKIGNEFYYAVQIASSKTQIKNVKTLKLKDEVHEWSDGNRYRYYVGKSSSFTEAVKIQHEKRKIIKDCFVVAFYNGKLISITEAQEIEQKLKLYDESKERN